MERKQFQEKIAQGFRVHPILAILGPRQVGKTTLARMFANSVDPIPEENYFDLENADDLNRLINPLTMLSSLKGLIIIDEIQRVPEIFPTLRVLVDKPNCQQRYLILGSASKDLLRQSSESLAGRIQYLELTPFSLTEIDDADRLWLRGGFPRSYLAERDEDSFLWRKAFIQTFLEQDIPNFGFDISPQQLRRFWMMLTDYHGNIFNASELGRSLGISYKTTASYLDILTGTLMIRQLRPWFENITKRQVKSPKVYFRDSGIYHSLLGISSMGELLTSRKLGASWEGWALEEVIRYHQVDESDCYFWATYAHAELDLLLIKHGKKLGFEFKYGDAPKTTRSMHIAVEELKLDELTVLYPGEHSYSLATGIQACGLRRYLRNPSTTA